MIYPLKNYIVTQKFGETITDSQGHTGIDLYQPIGTPVYAAEGGDILAAGVINNAYGNSAYGKCILIDHKNGYYTFYAHLDTIKVKTGMSVIQGAIIGTVGVTGNTSGPHLHFEIRTNPIWNRKNFIDPELYIGKPQSVVINTDKPFLPSLIELEEGDVAIVANSILNMRNQPGYNGEKLAQLYKNTQVIIKGKKVEVDGLTWYPVEIKGYLASKEGDTILLKKLV